ncbi:hypothetical protein MGN70_010788 [Eutypa lata]|nr:hypothetical protein MGN70_010788 [Eutypa lata]
MALKYVPGQKVKYKFYVESSDGWVAVDSTGEITGVLSGARYTIMDDISSMEHTVEEADVLSVI